MTMMMMMIGMIMINSDGIADFTITTLSATTNAAIAYTAFPLLFLLLLLHQLVPVITTIINFATILILIIILFMIPCRKFNQK